MFIKIENHAENTAKITDYPGDLSVFLWAHSFGVYNIVKIKAGVYSLVDRFSLKPAFTVSKPGKREIAQYIKNGESNNGN